MNSWTVILFRYGRADGSYVAHVKGEDEAAAQQAAVDQLLAADLKDFEALAGADEEFETLVHKEEDIKLGFIFSGTQHTKWHPWMQVWGKL